MRKHFLSGAYGSPKSVFSTETIVHALFWSANLMVRTFTVVVLRVEPHGLRLVVGGL